jgi:hypothetical protein
MRNEEMECAVHCSGSDGRAEVIDIAADADGNIVDGNTRCAAIRAALADANRRAQPPWASVTSTANSATPGRNPASSASSKVRHSKDDAFARPFRGLSPVAVRVGIDAVTHGANDNDSK